jgi:TMEM175 potassium channel family protein
MESNAGLETGVSKERTIAFSDGVFAIAITLLILNVEVPDIHPESGAELRRALDDTIPDLISYAIGFYVIGKFWLGHHSLFDNVRALTLRMMNANLLYLATIAVLPFPTGVLGDHNTVSVSVTIFAVAVTLAGLAEFLLLWLAYHEGVASPKYVAEKRPHYYETLTVPVVFLLSIPIAFAHPEAAKFFWLTLVVVRAGGARLGLMPSR